MNTEHFKEKLLAEKTTLEAELATVATKNSDNPADWEGKETDVDTDTADDLEIADATEGIETNDAIATSLETRLAEITTALEKIEADTYGICNVCGEKIEEDRLEANPAAATCKAHM